MAQYFNIRLAFLYLAIMLDRIDNLIIEIVVLLFL